MDGIGHLDADELSAPGGRPVLLVEAAGWQPPRMPLQAVIIGVDHAGRLPEVDADVFDLLLTSCPNPPQPWVQDGSGRHLAAAVHQNPLAATLAARVLRLGEQLSFADALDVESLAYSTLLGGSEFARWLAQTDRPHMRFPAAPLHIERQDRGLILTLNDPANHNAMSAVMRDALHEALANALDDPGRPDVCLRGAGRCFSTGGALAEFGTADDLAMAHAVRTLRSIARALDALGPRAHVHVHGACIGSGLEIAAAARHRTATADSWFQLPELAMGLLPGAGGTVSIARAIGRHRTLWMLLSAARLRADRALQWGLIHTIRDWP